MRFIKLETTTGRQYISVNHIVSVKAESNGKAIIKLVCKSTITVDLTPEQVMNKMFPLGGFLVTPVVTLANFLFHQSYINQLLVAFIPFWPRAPFIYSQFSKL